MTKISLFKYSLTFKELFDSIFSKINSEGSDFPRTNGISCLFLNLLHLNIKPQNWTLDVRVNSRFYVNDVIPDNSKWSSLCLCSPQLVRIWSSVNCWPLKDIFCTSGWICSISLTLFFKHLSESFKSVKTDSFLSCGRCTNICVSENVNTKFSQPFRKTKFEM